MRMYQMYRYKPQCHLRNAIAVLRLKFELFKHTCTSNITKHIVSDIRWPSLLHNHQTICCYSNSAFLRRLNHIMSLGG